MSDDAHDQIADPLLDDFRELEKLVGARKMAELRARCPHDGSVVISSIGQPDVRICTRCGEPLPVEEPPDER